jgi:hypothetical protein
VLRRSLHVSTLFLAPAAFTLASFGKTRNYDGPEITFGDYEIGIANSLTHGCCCEVRAKSIKVGLPFSAD